jgi:hypothetical protein
VLWYNAILSKQSHFVLPQYCFNGKFIQATKIKLQGERKNTESVERLLKNSCTMGTARGGMTDWISK